MEAKTLDKNCVSFFHSHTTAMVFMTHRSDFINLLIPCSHGKKNRLKGLILQQNSCRKASKPASIFYTPYVCVFFHFIVPCIKFRSPFLGKAQQLHEQLHTHISVCSIFVCPNNGMAANAWNVMHVMAHASALTL